MNLLRELIGGILIIAVAGIVAVAQNAVRPDGIPLVPKRVASVSEKTYERPSIGDPAEDASRSRVDAGARDGDPALAPSADELASGVISRERLAEILPGRRVVLIDARLAVEFEEGHIEGAINIPYEKLPEYYDRLTASVPLDAMVVCYCQSLTCDDSENLARELKFMGYANVILYKGGWDEWSASTAPAESPNAGNQAPGER
jgi:rhodanese-related sulfurtransferase